MPTISFSARRHARLLALLAALLLSACSLSAPFAAEQPTPAPAGAPRPDGPAALAGTLSYSNDFNTSYRARSAVALVDLHGFIARDRAWRIPSDSLTFGRLRLDRDNQTGSFYLRLPLEPPGTLNDLDHDGASDAGVRVFTVAFWDDPFGASDRHHQGWPIDLTSTIADTENANELTGGRLVVWAPDAVQQFPSGFGADHKLFTGDDPLQAVPAGWSVIDLSTPTFAIDRSATPKLTLYEEASYAVKDFSNLSYSKALQRLLEALRRDYAFSGIAGKQPDWDALAERLKPRALQAERDHDAQAFYALMRELAQSFHDGHVSLDGGDRDDALFGTVAAGGYGFAIRQADDGRYLVVFVQPGGPAARAGVQRGAELLAFNGTPAAEAVAAVQPLSGPFSTEREQHYEQQRYLLRARVGGQAQVRFANPGQPAAEQSLVAVDERASLDATAQHASDPTLAPVEYRMLESGLGYVRINTNDDDFDLIDELFARALDSFDYHSAPGIIVDLRRNDGGVVQGFAGYLTDTTIPLAQLEYFNSRSGKFEPDGPPDTIEPVENPYHFEKVAVLVGMGCYSACEIEAYGLSQLPGAVVVGEFPSAGVEAEVSQGQYHLPDDMWLQVPTGRFVLPDGSLFLEGKGVVPTLAVPQDAPTLLSDDDAVLRAAEHALQP